MSSSALSRRYARALIDLAKETNAVDAIGSDLTAFNEVLTADNGLMAGVFSNPSITELERKNVLNALLAKLNFNVLTSNFINLLLDKHRIVLFGDIVQSYEQQADDITGRKRAVVTTAQSISDSAERSQIQTALAEAIQLDPDKLIVQFDVDPDILGGIIARVGDDIYDASIRSRIQEIRSSLL